MRDFDKKNDPPSFFRSRGIGGLTALSVAAFLCALAGAKLLGRVVDQFQTPVEEAARHVDYTPTGSIQPRLSPCEAQRGSEKGPV